MADVILKVDGDDYGGWTSVEVRRSLEDVAGSFRLQVTDRWPDSGERRPLAPHVSCTLAIDGEPVLSGVIDDVAPSYDANSHSVQVSGRSTPGQLVDCACEIPTGELRGLSLAAIARRLAEPFGVDVVDLAQATEPFPRVQVEQGETVFDILERLARQRGVFLTDNALGQLVIRRRSTDLQCHIEKGVHVLSASADLRGNDQFSNYTVKGQAEGSDRTAAGISARSSGRAVDASVPIHRPMIVLSETQGGSRALKERAEFEAALRRGRARRWTYAMQGWRRPDGALWATAEEVEVTDDFMGLVSERLLVVAVALSFNDQGEMVELELAPPEGFDLIAEKVRVATKQQATGWDAL